MHATAKAVGSNLVMAADRKIVRGPATTPSAANDMICISSGFDTSLSDIPSLIPDDYNVTGAELSGAGAELSGAGTAKAPPSEAEIWLAATEKLVDPLNPETLVWDSAEGAARYVATVDEVISLVATATDDELHRHSEDVLQSAMARLEDEFWQLMMQNTAALSDGGSLQGSIRRMSSRWKYNSDVEQLVVDGGGDGSSGGPTESGGELGEGAADEGEGERGGGQL